MANTNDTVAHCILDRYNDHRDEIHRSYANTSQQKQRQQCDKILNQISKPQKSLITQLQNNHISPNILFSLYHFIHFLLPQSHSNNLAAGFTAAQILEGMAHQHHSKLHHFKSLMEKALQSLYTMSQSATQELRHQAHQGYLELRHQLQHHFHREFNHFLADFEHLFHENGWRSIRLHRKLGWNFSHELVAHDINRLMEFVKQIGDGLFVIDITGTLIDAGIIISQNTHWFDKLTHEAADVESFFAVSAFIDTACVLIGLTPLGWIGIICVGVTTYALHKTLMKQIVTPYLNYIDRRYS